MGPKPEGELRLLRSVGELHFRVVAFSATTVSYIFPKDSTNSLAVFYSVGQQSPLPQGSMCTVPRTLTWKRSTGVVRTNRCRIDDSASYAIRHGHMCADELPGWHNPCDLHKFYLLLYVSFSQLSCHLTVQDLCCISTCKPEQYTVTSCLQTCMTSCHMSASELPSSETSINSHRSASYAV